MTKTLWILPILLLIHLFSYGQSSDEKEIRRLEQQEVAAIQQADTVTLLKLWSKDFVVNNPYGQIVTLPQILGFIRAGKIDYTTFERITERVTIVDNVAIAMGREIVTPEKATEYAGKKVTRQYTDVWMKTKAGWREIARQATIVNIDGMQSQQ
ncbi:nuclear transport factor 2 family protein [Chitinophaga varians]|uniref:nuclear transport factor 2 family protein n=1 Tax=Chitinophaga varians TaxID=2202339 RepID=UPI00165F3019|nr:nuclear transport factor 2 family protein [Chitinophaga varians]MBC9911561.1 nuclear transport factor 2 family protein [Chitinophaga varians]